MAHPLIAAAGKLAMSRTAFFVYGALSGPLVVNAAKPAGQAARSLLKSSVKGAYLAGRTIQNTVTEAKEGLGDIRAEARAEVEQGAKARPEGVTEEAKPASPSN